MTKTMTKEDAEKTMSEAGRFVAEYMAKAKAREAARRAALTPAERDREDAEEKAREDRFVAEMAALRADKDLW